MTQRPMSEGMRGSVRWTIPWAALVVVAIFAFMQLDAAQRARGELAKARDDRRASNALRQATPPEPARGEEPAPGPTARERALDDALTRAQETRRAAEARVSELERAIAEERGRADRTEALRATEKARADALEKHRADVAENLARTKALLAKGALLGKTEPVRQWLDDVASGDKTRIACAKARASKATSDQIEALAALLSETEAARLVDATHLVAALPAGPQRMRLVGDLLLALPPDHVPTGLDRVAAGLMELDVLERVLARGSNRLRDDVLRRAAAHAWTPDQRASLAAVLKRLLAEADPGTVRVGTQGFAFLRAPGGAGALADLLRHASPVVRAGAAYALAHVPDRASVAARATAAVPALLADADFHVRAAGLILAEDLCDGALVFDPGASAPERAQAIEKIKARLGS